MLLNGGEEVREDEAVRAPVRHSAVIGELIAHGMHSDRPGLRDDHAGDSGGVEERGALLHGDLLIAHERGLTGDEAADGLRGQRVGEAPCPLRHHALHRVGHGVHRGVHCGLLIHGGGVAGIKEGALREHRGRRDAGLGHPHVIREDRVRGDLASRAGGGRDLHDRERLGLRGSREYRGLRDGVHRKERDDLGRVHR